MRLLVLFGSAGNDSESLELSYLFAITGSDLESSETISEETIRVYQGVARDMVGDGLRTCGVEIEENSRKSNPTPHFPTPNIC